MARITLNRPERLNTIVPPMPDEFEAAIGEATLDPDVKVIVLRGAGRSFCARYDFGGGFHHWDEALTTEGRRDPGKDFALAVSPYGGTQLIVNQAHENMGLRATQTLGPILDGLMRNTPGGLAFVPAAATDGVRAATARRDGSFGDYSARPHPTAGPTRPTSSSPEQRVDLLRRRQ